MLAALAALSARVPLVLLHGWGVNEQVWRPLLPALRARYEPLAPRLPPLADPLSALLPQLPERAVYLGWSLGGALAMRLAQRCPERVLALVSVAANPCFVRRPGWTAGMPAGDFSDFEAMLAADPDGALARFQGLMVRGDPSPRERRRELRALLAGSPALVQGLGLLRELDLRAALADLGMPCLHLLGGRDALVPRALAQRLPRAHRVVVLDDAGHVPFLSHPKALLALLDTLVDDGAGRPSASAGPARVAAGFSRAVKSYDAAADLQRETGVALLRWARPAAPGMRLVAAPVADLGCGTGALTPALRARRPESTCIGIDIAQAMLGRARGRAVAHWVCGDAAALPIRSASLGVLWSNMTLQWCADLPRLMDEAWRVLMPGGRFAFSVPGPDSLWELRAAWRMLDDADHVRRFASLRAWRDAARAAGFTSVQWRTERRVRRYAGLRALAHELRALGASNRSRRPDVAAAGSTRRWRELESAYRLLCGGRRASWQLFYVSLSKPR